MVRFVPALLVWKVLALVPDRVPVILWGLGFAPEPPVVCRAGLAGFRPSGCGITSVLVIWHSSGVVVRSFFVGSSLRSVPRLVNGDFYLLPVGVGAPSQVQMLHHTRLC